MAGFYRSTFASYIALYRKRGLSAGLLRLFPSFNASSSLERRFSSESSERASADTKLNFSCPGYDSESESEEEKNVMSTREANKKKLPPPYDPFRKKPMIEEEQGDPKDLQYVFHRMRTEGLNDYAAKMFDGLSKDGLTHEALELFRQISEKGLMPDVVAHTAVIEAYADAGQPKDALRTFMKMLASGVAPNAYTYAVLLKVLARDGMLKDARKCLLEMITTGIEPSASTYTAVFEAYVKEGKSDEARVLLVEMKEKGFSPEETAVREVCTDKRGMLHRTVMDILFSNH